MILETLDCQLSKQSIILVDLDGTLIATDTANSLSYQKAISNCIRLNIPEITERITSEYIRQCFGINDDSMNTIIEYKRGIYPQFLSETLVNQELLIFLQQAKLICPIYLVTNGEKNRVKETLHYHKLLSFFSNIFYCKNVANKYQYVIDILSISPVRLIIFENEEIEIKKAGSIGIPKKNIFQINN